MFLFNSQSKKFSKKIALLAVFVLLFQLFAPITSRIVVHADEISDAQQQEVSLYLEALQIKEQIKQQAEAIRNQFQESEPALTPAPAQEPASEPAPATTDAQSQPANTESSASGTRSADTTTTTQSPNTVDTAGTTDPVQQSGPASQTGPDSGTTGGLNVTVGQGGTSSATSATSSPPSIFDQGSIPRSTIPVNVEVGSTQGTASQPGVDIHNQADDGVAISKIVSETDQTVETENKADVTNKQSILADSGHNNLTCFGKCEGSITVGPATSDVFERQTVNKSDVSTGSGSSTGGIQWPWERYGTGPKSGIENGGDGAVNIGDTTVLKELAIIQTNDALVKNDFDVTANTGNNNALTNYKFKDFTFTTKDAWSRLTLLNEVNTNLFNSEFWKLYIPIDGDFSGNINLMDSLVKLFGQTAKFNLFNDAPSASIVNTSEGEDAINTALVNLKEKLLITSEQAGLIHNKIDVIASTGQNAAISGFKLKDFNYQSGDATAVLTLLNFLNTQLVNSHWALGVINVFADWSGDLILPSIPELLWGADGVARSGNGGLSVTIGESGEDALSKATIMDRTESDVSIMNNANVDSRVNTNSVSGNDVIAFYDDLDDLKYVSGQAKNLATQFMLGNTFKFGGGVLKLVVNNLGSWSGGIEGAPENAKIQQYGNGVILTAESATGGNLSSLGLGPTEETPGEGVNIQNAGDDAFNLAEIIRDREVIIQSTNAGKILNDINVKAVSGESTFAGLDGKRLNLTTGNTKTITTIGNVFNTTLVGSKVMDVIVNVVGDWKGKILFKKSLDLQAVMTASREQAESGDTIVYTIEYSNLHDKDAAQNAVLTAQYDAQKTELVDAGGATENPTGVLKWALGDVGPSITATKTFSVKVKQGLDTGEHQLQASVVISSPKPESVTSNNTDGFVVTVPAIESSGGGSGSGNQGGSGSNSGNTNNPGNTDNAGNNNGNQSGNTGSTGTSGTVTGAIGGGGSSGGSSGGGGSSTGSGSATLRVEKTAQVSGGEVLQGSTIHYTILIRNTGDTEATDVKAYDRLKIDGNQSPDDFSWNIGKVMSREEVRIEYDVEITQDAVLGKYINTAYASGFDIRNKTVVSNDSSATITVVKGTRSAASGNGGTGGTGPRTNSSIVPSTGTSAPQAGTQPQATDTASRDSAGASTGTEGTLEHASGTGNAVSGSTEIQSPVSKGVRSHAAISRSGGVPNRAVTPSAVFGKQVKITRTIPVAGAGQAFAAIHAPLTANINADAYVLALADMDRSIEQHTRGGGIGVIVWLWLALLLLLLVIGYLTYREHQKQKKISNS